MILQKLVIMLCWNVICKQQLRGYQFYNQPKVRVHSRFEFQVGHSKETLNLNMDQQWTFFLIFYYWLFLITPIFEAHYFPKLRPCFVGFLDKPNLKFKPWMDSTVRVVTTRITLPNRGFLGSLNLFNFTSFSSPTPMGWRSQFIEPFVCRLTPQKGVRNFQLFNSSSSYYNMYMLRIKHWNLLTWKLR